MSTTWRERDREREWDGEVIRGPRKAFTTVRRYKVPDQFEEEDIVYEKDKVIVKRERDPPTRRYEEPEREPVRRDVKYRVIEREREVERSPPRREIREFRYERAPSPPSPPSSERVRESRFVREREFEREPQRTQPYELEKYSKSTEYFSRPDPPQPIIIRQEPQPIIIQEAPRKPIVLQREEPQYEFIEREEVREDRQLVRREQPRKEEPPRREELPRREDPRRDEDDYYYERTTREVDRGPKGGGGGAEAYDERGYDRRDVRPRDSASQYGGYSSDDSYEYVRKEKITEEGGRGRDVSPLHKRHLAEGALAGLGAAELVRHHRIRQGEDPRHRARQAVGAAALGAVGAEVISRAKSRRRSSRDQSRSRSSSRSARRERRSRRKHRSKSRSQSRARNLVSLAGIAAVGALAGYALKKSSANKETVVINERRSRSRRRRGSVDGFVEQQGRSESKRADPEQRNRRIAQAGLASAAAAGIWDRVRSRSRGGKSRERSRIRTGVPIAAAGLGGAALAGLYERNKGNKEARAEVARERSLSRSRSRSRSRSVLYPEDTHRPRRAASDNGLVVEYGDEPIYPDRESGRRGSRHHRDDEPGEYRRRHRSRSSDSGSSPDRRRHKSSRSRSRSRRRAIAETAAAAGAAGIAAHELGRRSERKRAKEERRRQREAEQADPYAHDHSPPRFDPPPVGAAAPRYPIQNDAYYPQGNVFPPPPPSDYREPQLHEPEYRNGPADYPPTSSAYYDPLENPPFNPADHSQYPPYNPSDYPPAPGVTPQPVADEGYGHQSGHSLHHRTMTGEQLDPHLGYPTANDTFAGDPRHGGERGRGEHENDPENSDRSNADGVNGLKGGAVRAPEAPKSKNVQWDLDSSVDSLASPVDARNENGEDPAQRSDHEGNGYDRDERDHDSDRRRRRRRRNRSSRDSDGATDEPTPPHPPPPQLPPQPPPASTPDPSHPDPSTYDQRKQQQQHHNKRSRDPSPASDSTVDLPPRFDELGRRVPEPNPDPLADRIEDVLSGRGGVGGIFGRVVGDLLGGGGGGGGGGGRGSGGSEGGGRRRRRRR
ncbi:hypothetical protein LTR50_000828 [Elasticomyces elasticus]|nr:hypothetical protein LTR50_000828 [Elasticomyces elasticus]